mgnify:CR=1 FL=1
MVKKLLGDAVRKNVSAAIFRKTALRNRQRFLYGLSLILKTILAIHSWKHFMPWQLTYIFP